MDNPDSEPKFSPGEIVEYFESDWADRRSDGFERAIFLQDTGYNDEVLIRFESGKYLVVDLDKIQKPLERWWYRLYYDLEDERPKLAIAHFKATLMLKDKLWIGYDPSLIAAPSEEHIKFFNENKRS